MTSYHIIHLFNDLLLVVVDIQGTLECHIDTGGGNNTYMFECIPASQFGLSILECAFPLPAHAMVPTFASLASIIAC